MGYHIQRMMPRHFRIMDLVLQGKTCVQIGKELGCHPDTVTNVSHSPIFQDELARRRARIERQRDDAAAVETFQAKQVIEEAAVDAARAQVDALESPQATIKLRAADAILDRALGKGGPAKADTTPGTIVLSAERIDLLMLALRESRELEREHGRRPGPDGDGLELEGPH